MNSGQRRPFSDEPESPSHQLMIWLRVIVTIGIAALLVVACVTRDPRLLGGGGPMNGAVVLSAAYGFYDNDQHCRGIGDFSDVTEGAHLTLVNDTSQVLDVHRLGPGTPSQLGRGPCTFDFKIERVALGAKFYTFTVAGHDPIQVQPHDMHSHLVLFLASCPEASPAPDDSRAQPTAVALQHAE